MSTQYSVIGRTAILRLDNPPVNGLGHATRQGTVQGLHRALDSGDVDAVVLTGREGFFSAGADITEFGTPRTTAEPTLGDLIAALEAADKPVVAAIDGTCFGGGLELALGAHYRVATSKSRIGLPEVNLGLVPGAGGTQRLPRLVGAAVAADMISGGAPRRARELGDLPGQRLFDRVVDGDVMAAALELAAEMAAVRPLPRVRDLSVGPGDAGAVSAMRERLGRRSRGFLAPAAALALVEKAATTPFEEGLAEERKTFLELMNGDQSAALRHAFFAERAARKVPDIPPGTSARRVDTVAVIGAGTMGGGIAMNFLDAGIPVTVVESSQEALDRGLGVMRGNYQRQVAKGKLTSDGLERRMALLTPTLDYADVSDSDLVIEAAFEDMDVKRSVFTRLDEVAKPGAILASNTSTLDIDAIAAVTGRPADVLGMHFFSPANVMKLLEIVRGAKTADDVLVTAMAVGQRIGKTGVVAGVCDGFIGNRMLAKYRDAAMELLRAGATPADIDSAAENFGFAMGPFRTSDLAGNDIGWAIRKRRYAEDPDMPRDEIADALCEMGRFGQKVAAGWYDYKPGSREAIPSPDVDDLLASFHAEHGTELRSFEADEIVQRLVFALIDEGARILDEGIALRSSDIDVVYIAGYGFPRYRGGPMFYADTVGAAHVLSGLRRFHGDDGWEPPPLLMRLAGEGGTFD
ncbi:3-hydroxyacyl-CoA dehydrogenase NAD-binding domain-containing protein [Streptomyces sp. HUAS TT20]|uniref:3-hydroxyacyl-CoA dehydrogenase NAD-binding domain-containing protein n=1 Tax=Streptomyces sp. HUAS TT20 TaxID=3447509 RepID=UPI0021D88BB8|nr:3-hydroxyacyl-CoA dehydrogenase NAD-binding domain-containing protein [Streptomyces sp. HUAS 15-9]UXY31055.1 3-hydroxyacyl-CoA dehydrogenase NAD-binding domain-containing protein [Streptomyces sp. HUAS 15-9]